MSTGNFVDRSVDTEPPAELHAAYVSRNNGQCGESLMTTMMMGRNMENNNAHKLIFKEPVLCLELGSSDSWVCG